MNHTFYPETDTGHAGDAIVRMADLFCRNAFAHDGADDSAVAEAAGGEVFARGRFRAMTVRPSVLYTDCDIDVVSARQVRSTYRPFVCVAMLLDGRWSSRPGNGACYHPKPDVPTLMIADEPLEFTTDHAVGQKARMIALCVDHRFFETGGVDPACRLPQGLERSAGGGLAFYELARCDMLKSILRRLHDNPYRGSMAALYAEGLSLAAIVDAVGEVTGRERCFCRQRQIHREAAREVRRLIDQDLRRASSIREMAENLGFAETTLRRAFKMEFGTTIVDYLRDRRLEVARTMLRNGQLRISEIAFRLGYADAANFSNAYKNRFGYAPKFEVRTIRH